jgi:ABC-type protease/lipase transport system fused ATPase/permease subunit
MREYGASEYILFSKSHFIAVHLEVSQSNKTLVMLSAQVLVVYAFYSLVISIQQVEK